MTRLRLATRKSRLALWQSEHVAERLRAAHPGLAVELVPLSTRGDEVLDRPLAEIGGKGLFLKELEAALLDGSADLAVHSLKDVPAESPAGLRLEVFLPRADAADILFARGGLTVETLPPGARVGTSSLRRTSQLRARRPDLDVVALRGNVETRLGRLDQGDVDAVVLAAAGVRRLGIRRDDEHRLEPPDWLPAPGQGVIVVQCRNDDGDARKLLKALDCPDSRRVVSAERAVVEALGADCRMPLAAFARIDGESLELRARLGGRDGELIDVIVAGSDRDAGRLGRRAAADLLAGGGRRLLDELADFSTGEPG